MLTSLFPRLFLATLCLSLSVVSVASSVDSAAWQRAAGAYTIKLDNGDITVLKGGKVVFSARGQAAKYVPPSFVLTRGRQDEMGCLIEVAYTPLSLVGDVLSYQRTYRSVPGECPELLRDTGTVALKSVNLHTLAPEKIVNLFPEAAVLGALRRDAFIRRLASADVKTTTLAGLGQLLARQEDCSARFTPDAGFGFHHLKGNLVAVRLGLAYSCPSLADDPKVTQLGLLLRAPAALKKALAQGVLMNDMPNSSVIFDFVPAKP